MRESMGLRPVDFLISKGFGSVSLPQDLSLSLATLFFPSESMPHYSSFASPCLAFQTLQCTIQKTTKNVNLKRQETKFNEFYSAAS